MDESSNTEMLKLLETHVETFRARTAGLGQTEKHVSSLGDFSAPCQVHLFWFAARQDIHYSLLVATRLTKTDDLIKVVGPLNPARATETLLETLNDEMWDEPADDRFPITDQSWTVATELASELGSAINKWEQYVIRCVNSGGHPRRTSRQECRSLTPDSPGTSTVTPGLLISGDSYRKRYKGFAAAGLFVRRRVSRPHRREGMPSRPSCLLSTQQSGLETCPESPTNRGRVDRRLSQPVSHLRCLTRYIRIGGWS